MINCRNCIHWVDESLEEIEADQNPHTHIFMGCRIFGFRESNERLQSCKNYQASANLFTICSVCHITVPKVCVSLGECANCTDTDLFCLESCKGDESRKYCTHFVRLHTEGMLLINHDCVVDLFPTLKMPGEDKSVGQDSSPDRFRAKTDTKGRDSGAECPPPKSPKH